MSLVLHWTAHTRGGWAGAVEPPSAQWLWTHLRDRFPGALACTLMPDHVHLAPPDGSEPDLLRRVLQHHGRRFGARWEMGEPERATTPRIVARMIRYFVQNATRAQLIDDPFEWPWCTLRDLVGATVDPWTPLPRVATLAGMSPAALVRYFIGPNVPALVPPDRPIAASLQAIAEAAAAATRAHPQDIRRRGLTRTVFLGLGDALGGCPLADLAEACGIGRRSAYDLRSGVSPRAIIAARRCLADPRLRRWNAPPHRGRT